MARQTKTVERITNAGLAATYAAAHADGHSAQWHRDMVFHVKQGVGARVATIAVGRQFEGRTLPALTVNIAQSTEVFIGPFHPDYIQADGGVWINFDATTNTTLAALRTGVA